MDDLLGASPPGAQSSSAPPGAPPPPPGAPRAPGRPARDPEQRAASDERYAKMKEFEDRLPKAAREMRVAVYECRRGTESKASARPIDRILYSDWDELDLREEDALRDYLTERYGPGRYYMEPQDAHNRKLDKLPSWVVNAYEDEDDMDIGDDDAPRGRGRGRTLRRRAFVDDYDGGDDPLVEADPLASRANIADALTMQARSLHEQQQDAAKEQSSMLQTMMLMQQQQDQARREEERRREELREERRREEQREERERERLRAEQEERRREEEREERRREEERLRREHQERMEADRRAWEAQVQQQNKKMELMVAALPVLQKMFEPKTDPMLAQMMQRMTEGGDKTDPTQMLLLKHVLEKNGQNDSMQTMVSGLSEMSKMSSQLMSEQVRSLMQTTNEINQESIKQALSAARRGGDDGDDKGMMGQVVEALSNAGGLVDMLSGKGQDVPQPPQVPQSQMGYPQQHQPMPQAQQQPPPPPPQGPAVQGQIPEGAPPVPTGIEAVGGSLIAISRQEYQSEQEYQQLIAFMLSEMPHNLRVAVAESDEDQIFQICSETFMGNAELRQWIAQPGVSDWLRQYLRQLAPLVQQTINEMEQSQREAEEHEQARTQENQQEILATGEEAYEEAEDTDHYDDGPEGSDDSNEDESPV